MLRTVKNPSLLRIYFTTLFFMLSNHMVSAISILYALELGADIFQVNLIITISSTMAIMLEIPFGIFSDRWGRRPMLIYARAMITLGTLIRVFATDINHLFIASLFGGFAGGEFFPIMQSMIADKTEGRERQEAMSTMFVFSSIGGFVGPIISSSLLTQPQISLRNIYQIVLVAETAFLIYIVTQIRETKPKTSKTNSLINMRDLIRQKSYQYLLSMGFFYWFSHSTFDTYIKIYAKVGLNLSNAEVASLDAFGQFSRFLIRFVSATFLTRVPFRPALVSFMVLGGTTSLIASFANNYMVIVLFTFLQGISFGATRIMQNLLVANLTGNENRGVANSINQLVQSGANFARIFTSPIVETIGFPPVFILGGIAAFVATVPPLLCKAAFEAKPETSHTKGET